MPGYLSYNPFGLKIDTNELSFETWEKVAEVTVSAATAQVNLTGLDGDNDQVYMLFIRAKNADGANNNALYVRLNNDSGTNYNRRWLRTDGSNVNVRADTGVNSPFIGTMPAGGIAFCTVFIFATSGQKRMIISLENGQQSGICTVEWTNTADNVTQLNIVGGGTNSIDAGTKIILFRKTS